MPLEHIQMHPVDSSHIYAAGYDPIGRVMQVQFKDKLGSPTMVVIYHGVTQSEYDGFLAADSKGRYLNEVVKPSHGHEYV